METIKSNMSDMFPETSKSLEPQHDEDDNPPLPPERACRPPPIKPTTLRARPTFQPQFNPSTTMGTQSIRTPAPHAMEPSFITLASVPFKTFDATRTETTLILSRYISPSGIFRPPNEKAYHTPQSTPTNGLTPAGSYSCTSQCPSKGSASLAFSETVQRMYGSRKNLDSVTKGDQNLQPVSLVIKEFEKNGKNASIPKTSCTASESMGSRNEDHDANNNASRLAKIVVEKYPSTKNQQCNMILGNGQVAKKETDLKNFNVVDENKKCASQANTTNLLNQNLGTGINASGTNPQLQKLENGRRKERKRQQNREPFKRRKMRRKKENDEELLRKRVDNLRGEVSELRKELLRIAEESEEVERENDSLVEELVEKYGEESIADLINTNPAAP